MEKELELEPLALPLAHAMAVFNSTTQFETPVKSAQSGKGHEFQPLPTTYEKEYKT